MTDKKYMPLMHNQNNLIPTNETHEREDKTHSQQNIQTKKSLADILFQQQNENTEQEDDDQQNTEMSSTPMALDLSNVEDMNLSQHDLAEYQNLVSELSLPAECAQKLFDFAISKSRNASQTQQNNVQREHEQIIKQAMEDEEFGGINFGTSIQLAQRALQNLGNETLHALLEDKGLGDHPEIIRLFYRIGQYMDEDHFHNGGTANASNTKSVADILYNG